MRKILHSNRGDTLLTVLSGAMILGVASYAILSTKNILNSTQKAKSYSRKLATRGFVRETFDCDETQSKTPTGCQSNALIDTYRSDGQILSTANEPYRDIDGIELRARCNQSEVYFEVKEGKEAWQSLFEGIPFHCESNQCPTVKKQWVVLSQPSSRITPQHSQAVSTGKEILFWGVDSWEQMLSFTRTKYSRGRGLIYNIQDNTWRDMSIVGAPLASTHFRMVWTGEEMIVIGGKQYSTSHTDSLHAAAYNPSTDTWRTLSTDNAPRHRWSHAMVWTGEEVIVWGGETTTNFGTQDLANGKRYNPKTDTWSDMEPPHGTFHRRQYPGYTWTGTEMVIIGGQNFSGNLHDGARYNPRTDSWQLLPKLSLSDRLMIQNAVWTGTEVIVLGGLNAFVHLGPQASKMNVYRWSPTTNAWTAASMTNAPPKRANYHAGSPVWVWTGNRVMLAGCQKFNDTTDGLYDPSTDSWERIDSSASTARFCLHPAVYDSCGLFTMGAEYRGFMFTNKKLEAYAP